MRRSHCRCFLVRSILASAGARGKFRVQGQLRSVQRRLSHAAAGGHVTGVRHVRREHDANAEEPGDRVPLRFRRFQNIPRERALRSLLHATRRLTRSLQEAGL